MSDDLKKDLQLATSQQTMVQIAADELAPKAQKELAVRPKRNPSGPKVVRTKTPTVKAAPQPVEVAQVEAEVPQVQVTASAPAESDSPAPSAPPMARPTPVPLPSTGGGGQSTGSEQGGGIGTAIGSVLGGILGGIARGGVVVGDDHCDPRTDGRRRGGGGVMLPGSPVYTPNPGGNIGADPRRRGGEIGSRFPINPMAGIGGRRR
jgi:hypothetical protein